MILHDFHEFAQNASVEAIIAGHLWLWFQPELGLLSVLLNVDVNRFSRYPFIGIEEKPEAVKVKDGRHGIHSAKFSRSSPVGYLVSLRYAAQGNRMKCIAGGGTDSRLPCGGGRFGFGFMLWRAEAAGGGMFTE